MIAAPVFHEPDVFADLQDKFSSWNARQVRRLGHRAYFWLAALVSLVVVADVYHFHRIGVMQNRIFDTLMNLRVVKPAPDPDIVIVDIDEASLASMAKDFGRWPWPNQVFGEFVAGIEAQKPKAIVFDILFSDPDISRPESDMYFNEVIAGNANTFFPVLRLSPRNDHLSQIRPHMLPGLEPLSGEQQEDKPIAMVVPHVPAALANGRLGSHNVEPDVDGVIRHGLRYLSHGGWAIPSLPARVNGLKLVGTAPDYLINWRGGPYTYHFISFAEVYQDLLRSRPQRPSGEFAGKIVIIGSTAPSLFDVKASPMAHIHPGVEMLATMIDNLKNDDYLRTQPRWLMAGASLLFIWSMAWALSREIRTDVFDGVFTSAQIGFLALSWASLNLTDHYLDLSAAITFGTLYFAVARLYASQSRRWLANSHLYDLRARPQGNCMLTLLEVRLPVGDKIPRRRMEQEVNRMVGLSPLAACRILNFVEDPGLLRELFEDTVLIYWLTDEDGQSAVISDSERIEAALVARFPSVPSIQCHRISRPLCWEDADGWREPLRKLVLESLAFKN